MSTSRAAAAAGVNSSQSTGRRRRAGPDRCPGVAQQARAGRRAAEDCCGARPPPTLPGPSKCIAYSTCSEAPVRSGGQGRCRYWRHLFLQCVVVAASAVWQRGHQEAFLSPRYRRRARARVCVYVCAACLCVCLCSQSREYGAVRGNISHARMQTHIYPLADAYIPSCANSHTHTQYGEQSGAAGCRSQYRAFRNVRILAQFESARDWCGGASSPCPRV